MRKPFIITGENLGFEDIQTIASKNYLLELSDECRNAVRRCRLYLNDKLKNNDRSIYGINTGFGSLHKVAILPDQLEQLQENLVMSHACGTGKLVPREIVKLMLLLKIKSLSLGHSGVQEVTIDRLLWFYNEDITPVVYDTGSLGASGDLAPLAHLSLPLIGRGEVYYQNEILPTEKVYAKFNMSPIRLQSKEGLALLNGTQFMNAYGVWAKLACERLSKFADQIGAISLDAFDCKLEPFEDLIQQIRNHEGQIETARVIRKLLSGSEIAAQAKQHVQDPYSFRCIPQVHGSFKQVLRKVSETFLNELNAVTDNPLIFPEEDKILAGGNFHGEQLALDLDYLALGTAEIGNISERRVFQLVSGQRGLPDFLVAEPGVNSGFMIPQYTAASLVSKNKQLCSPASIDSIVSSNGQEDHVSMGANGATKLYEIILNVQRVLAIELFTASQALEFRRPSKSSSILEGWLQDYRKQVPFVSVDRPFYKDIQESFEFLEH